MLWNHPFEFPILSWIVFLPGVGGLILLFFPKEKETLIKWAANLPLKRPVEDGMEAALGRLQLSALIIYGLCEVVVLLGFILFLLAGARNDFYVFLGLGIFYLFIFFPRFKEWEEWLKIRV